MNEILWSLFRKTGDIKYYLLIRQIEGEVDETTKSRGNNS